MWNISTEIPRLDTGPSVRLLTQLGTGGNFEETQRKFYVVIQFWPLHSWKYNFHILWRVNPPWQDTKKWWQLMCNYDRFDCPMDVILSTKCLNQGLLIDGTIDRNLSKSCQLGHIDSCSGHLQHRCKIQQPLRSANKFLPPKKTHDTALHTNALDLNLDGNYTLLHPSSQTHNHFMDPTTHFSGFLCLWRYFFYQLIIWKNYPPLHFTYNHVAWDLILMLW
jgi:hypothetical protein